MNDRIKLTCQNPNHPFKQKWYWYVEIEGEMSYIASKEYCSSCASYLNMLKTVIRVMGLEPKPTLYGYRFIHSDKEQLKQLIDEL